MGSGRGKTRRAAVVWTDQLWSWNIPEVVREAWKGFIADNGLSDTTVVDYYGHDPYVAGGIERIAYEILQDLVAIGIVDLPRGAKVDGLSPQMSVGWKDENIKIDGDEVLILTTRNPRARRRKVIVDDEPGKHLRKDTTMGSLESLYIAASLARAANAIFDLQEDTALLTQF